MHGPKINLFGLLALDRSAVDVAYFSAMLDLAVASGFIEKIYLVPKVEVPNQSLGAGGVRPEGGLAPHNRFNFFVHGPTLLRVLRLSHKTGFLRNFLI